MNAVVALCHFCESHGPRVVFCTQVFKEDKITTRENPIDTNCPACTSIGIVKTFITKDKNGIVYCSKQIPSTETLEGLLKHACIRSLSCEVCGILTLSYKLTNTERLPIGNYYEIRFVTNHY